MKRKLIIHLTTTYLQFSDIQTLPLDEFDFCLVIDESEKPYLDKIDPALQQEVHIIGEGDVNDASVFLNYQQTKSKIKAILAQKHKHYEQIFLLTTSEFNIILASTLAKELGLESRSPHFLERFRDKAVMKRILQQHHIRVPQFALINKEKLADVHAYYLELKKDLGEVFIIKPVNLAASIDTVKIANLESFQNWAMQEALHPYVFEAEEFIEGDLYHSDHAMQDGKIIFSACCEYTFPVAEAFTRKTPLGSYALSEEDPRFKILNEFATKVLVALGGCTGVSHMEIFLTKQGEPVFLEIGARPPGAISMKMYQKIYGVSLVNWHICALARIHFNTHYQRICHGFWAFIPPVKGVVKSIHTFNDFKGNVILNLDTKVGDVLQGISGSAVDHVGSLEDYHDDINMIQADFEKLKQCEVIQAEG